MLRIGFLAVQKAVPDKPRDTREIGGEASSSSPSWSRDSGQLSHGWIHACRQRGGRGCISLPDTSPAHTGTGLRGSGISDAHSRQLREADGVLCAMKWWI